MNPFSDEAIAARRQEDAQQETVSLQDNPFSDEAIGLRRQQQLKANLLTAVKENPDQMARAVDLSKRTGIPADVVARNLQNVELQDAVTRADAVLQTSPVIARRMREKPLFAKVAHDDVEQLAEVESAFARTLKNIPRSIAAAFPGAGAGLYGVAAAPFEAAGQAFGAAEDALADIMGAPRGMTKNVGAVAGEFLLKQQRTARAVEKSVAPQVTEETGIIERGIYGGVQSATQTAITLPLALRQGGEKAVLGILGAITGGRSYGQAREKGVDPATAAVYGVSDAVIEVATERIPVARLLGDIKGGTSFAKTLARQVAAEVPGEQVATILQDMNEWAVVNPDKPFSQYLVERPSRAAETLVATIVGSSIQASAGYTISDVTGRVAERAQKAQQAEQTSQGIQEILGAVTNSKLAKRDPAALAETVQELADDAGVSEVYVDAQAFAEALRQSAVLKDSMPESLAQLEEALQTGGDIAVPMGELAAIAGTPAADNIVPFVRRSPDGLTATEAQQLGEQETEQMRQEAETILSSAEQQSAAQASAEAVRSNVFDQLSKTGRFTDDVNTAYANFVRDFYATQSQRLGTTAEELFKQYPLQIVAESPVGQVLNQGETDPADTMLELGGNEALFQIPKSAAQELTQIAAEKSPGLVIERESITQMDGSESPTGNWSITTPSGETAVVTERDGQVWLNVAGLTTGSGGSLIYDLVANYALNNGLVFVGDPAGLSDAAMVRRAENMLSSAVKYGTTDHIAPHPRQLEGSDTVPPLKWRDGDTKANIRSLMEVTTAANAGLSPAGTGVTYDAAADQFLDSEGQSVGGDALAVLSDLDRELSGSGAGGQATLRRDALFRSLLSGEDQRRAVLDRVRRVEGERGSQAGGALAGSFYQGLNKDGPDGPRGAFNPLTNTIAILNGADLSTTLHELGHFYLEVLADLASRPNAPAQITADMRALLGWFGFNGDLAAWRAQTLDERRDAHEQFARGFEAYLFEGKAPNIEMQSMFQRFRSWLKRIYRTIKELNVELTPDVRGVMDRLVATDEQIRFAEQAAAYMPLFETAEAAGMTPEQFVAYQRQNEQSTAEAREELTARSLRDMKWFEGAKSRELKRLQKAAEAQRKAVKEEVREEVRKQPVYQAMSFLRFGDLEIPADANRTQRRAAEQANIEGNKLSLPALKEMYGEEANAPWRYFSTGKTGMVAAQGMHPDVVAELFEFSSGDHLVRSLLEAPPMSQTIEAITDQRMLERYGDMADQQALENAAMEAVHNEARARLVATEMKALEKMAGASERSTGVNVIVRAAKQFAAETIARKKIRDIRPAQYIAAEGRAGRQASDALKKGDSQSAAIAKRNQLVNHYGAKTANEALAEVDKGVAYLIKFNRDIKTIDAEYLDQIHQLLEQYDLRRGQSLRAIDKRKSFAAWVESQRENGIEPLVDQALIDEASKVHYRDLTMEGFRGLVDTIKNIEHLGRLKRKLLLAKDEREFKDTESEIEKLIRDNAKGVRPVELEGRKGVKPWLDGFWAGHRKVSSLMRQMSGGKDGGALWEYFVRPMNERATMESVEGEKATMKLVELYKPMLAMKGGLTGDKRFIPEINASLSRGGRIAIALNQGNETNRRRVMEGDGWNERQVQAILKTLTRQEWEFVQGVWDFIDSYWPQIAEKEKRVSGVVPDKVDAEAFTVTLPDGAAMNLRGGYYPIKYDADRSTRSEQQEGAEMAKDMMRGVFTRATTRRGHTKARTETVNRPIRKDLNVITEHVSQVVHDLAWHEWLIDANKLLGSEKISEAIRETQGVEVLRTIKDAVQAIATADVVPQTKIDRALLMLRANVSRSTMGFSLTTALLQPFGLSQSMVRIGAKHVLRGAARWAGEAARFENSMNWIGEKSDFMRLRSKTFNRELNEIRGRVTGKQSQARQIIDASLFMLMQKMQLVADVPTWIGQYEKALAEGADDATAVAMADQAVLDAQGGGQTKDMAEFQRKHPMLTMFYSYFNTTFNLVAESTGKTDFKNPMAVAGWLSDMALLLVIPAILPALLTDFLKGGGDEDDPEDWAKKIVRWQLGFLLAPVIGVREFGGPVSGFDYAGPPAARIVSDMTKAGTQVAQGEVDEPMVMALVRLFGTAFGIPTVQATRTYRGWEAWEEGDAPASSILFGPPPKD